ncbi:hypothetical protein C2845_PM01G06850 [Panicum miliaceum]|uniref:Sulfhydryl oxidase n=1 Tax=Panicum miliaceum TaxID=4540 RepID=A0A3L6TMI0_PANMI|nr:hypothetical protein C2845_PM01G06850 [Panicum miliaceum]
MPLPGWNPLAPVLQTVAAFSRHLLIAPDAGPDDHRLRPLLSLSLSPPPPPSPPPEILKAMNAQEKDAKAAPLTKEEVGRATWMLLHTIAAQFPDEPTRQQKRDVKELMHIISRLYPCKECADHFKEVLKANPVQAGSQAEFSQWLCYVHNVVNRSLGKPIFPCQRVTARWDPEYGNIELNGRRLKERYSFTIRKTRELENIRTDDYQPVDPSPSSKATIRPGPIEHGAPILPYVPRYPPPSGHPKDVPAAESPGSSST